MIVTVTCKHCDVDFGLDGSVAKPRDGGVKVIEPVHCPYCSFSYDVGYIFPKLKAMSGGVNITGGSTVIHGDIAGRDMHK